MSSAPELSCESPSPVLVEAPTEPLKTFVDEAPPAAEVEPTNDDVPAENASDEDDAGEATLLSEVLQTPVKVDAPTPVKVDAPTPVLPEPERRTKTALSVLADAGPLLLWEGSTTAPLFISGVSFYLLTNVLGYTVVTLGAYLLMALIIVLGVLTRAGTYLPGALQVEARVADVKAALAAAVAFLDRAVAHGALRLKAASTGVVALAAEGSLKDQALALGALYCVSTVGTWMSTTTLLAVSFLALFLVPVAYTRNQRAVDDAVRNTESELRVLGIKAARAASPLAAQARAKCGEMVDRVSALTPWKKKPKAE